VSSRFRQTLLELATAAAAWCCPLDRAAQPLLLLWLLFARKLVLRWVAGQVLMASCFLAGLSFLAAMPLLSGFSLALLGPLCRA